VHCPSCLSGYELPEDLLGPGGARVRCPACAEEFLVRPAAESRSIPPAATREVEPGAARGAEQKEERFAGADARRGGSPPGDAAAVGTEVFTVLSDFLGEDLARSRTRGTVLSDHGPAVMAVWDEYRRRAGAGAPTGPFLAALRDCCGVDLTFVRAG